MFTAVNEAAKTFNPLAEAIALFIVRRYIKVLEFFEYLSYSRELKSSEKNIKKLAYALKIEYPHESEEYVEFLARDIIEGTKYVYRA